MSQTTTQELRPALPTTLRLGTRASVLATTQSEWVADHLRAAGHDVELVPVRTEGDTNRASLSVIGGQGVFASALREALRAGQIDLAVHSYKDVPTIPEEGLVVAAVPVREDPRDALISRDGLTLAELPPGSSIGTGSARRAAQLRELRPDLEVRDIRGNIETRISYVRRGELDAVVLACAGLSRVGRLEEATERLDLATMLPAPGQGALAVECRADDTALRERLVALLEHEPTRRATDAERALLNRRIPQTPMALATHAQCPRPTVRRATQTTPSLSCAPLPPSSRTRSRSFPSP